MTQQRDGRPQDPGPDDPALSVLRGIWTARQQGVADVELTPGKVCKNMKNIGFAGIAEGGAEGDSTAGPVGEGLRSAWRDRLQREGKLPPGAVTVRELLLGDAGPEPPAPPARGR